MSSKIQIAVIDSGWVIIGNTDADIGNSVVNITNASVIRVWGTDKGLGQIAINGPTKTTVLDKIGIVHVERSQLKFLIDCDESKWTKP